MNYNKYVLPRNSRTEMYVGRVARQGQCNKKLTRQ